MYLFGLGWLVLRFIGLFLLKTYKREGWHWPPAGKHRISGIQKVETLIFGILGLNWFNLNKFGRNSSFTRQVGLIIGSSRSGTSFSSCLASSTYFPIPVTKKCLFLRYNFLFVSAPCGAYPLQPISGPCSIEKYPSSRMANRYTCIFDAG